MAEVLAGFLSTDEVVELRQRSERVLGATPNGIVASTMNTLAILIISVLAVVTAGCGGKQATPAPTSEQPQSATRPAMTRAECTAAGGEVVGDIGDGAVHRPDYRCPRSGEPPIGTITAEAGQPMAVEGAVCCR